MHGRRKVLRGVGALYIGRALGRSQLSELSWSYVTQVRATFLLSIHSSSPIRANFADISHIYKIHLDLGTRAEPIGRR